MKLKAKFINENDRIFRIKTKLSIGKIRDTWGAVFLLNPGSLRLTNEVKWSRLLVSCEEEVSGTLGFDSTMKQLLAIIYSPNPA
jgi:hypothetical protein